MAQMGRNMQVRNKSTEKCAIGGVLFDILTMHCSEHVMLIWHKNLRNI
jgi:hypothetical protein